MFIDIRRLSTASVVIAVVMVISVISVIGIALFICIGCVLNQTKQKRKFGSIL